MPRTLIVARMTPERSGAVAELFAESDRTELPHLLGVTGRSLFSFHDLYFHLIESERDTRAALAEHAGHPLFADIDAKLKPHIRPYDPGWRQPKDAMAREFYRWPAW